MASLPRLAVREPVERIHAALDEHGAVIVEGLLDQPLLAEGKRRPLSCSRAERPAATR